MSHQWEKRSDKKGDNDDEEEDMVDVMIKKTGCTEQNYAVQDCMFENRDWRKCQKEVKAFRECMMKSNKTPSKFSVTK